MIHTVLASSGMHKTRVRALTLVRSIIILCIIYNILRRVYILLRARSLVIINTYEHTSNIICIKNIIIHNIHTRVVWIHTS